MRWIVLSLILLAVIAVVSRFLARRKLGKAATVHRLTPPGWVVWGAAFGVVGLTGVGFVLALVDGPLRLVLTGLAILYALGVAVLFWYAFLSYFAWTTDGFATWDPWRKHRFVRWADAAVGRSALPLHTRIADQARTVHVPNLLLGMAEMHAFLERRRAPVPVRP